MNQPRPKAVQRRGDQLSTMTDTGIKAVELFALIGGLHDRRAQTDESRQTAATAKKPLGRPRAIERFD